MGPLRMNTGGNRLMRRTEVQEATGLGCSSIYLLMQNEDEGLRFPPPVKIGQRSRWLQREVQDWIVRQADRSRGHPA